MTKIYRAGIVGFAHMHINDVAEHFVSNPHIELVACADTVPAIPELRDATYTRKWNLRNALTKLGIPKSYDDYHEMLAKEHFDLMIITSENVRHPEIVEACATAGVNVCVEKPMAMSLSDALRMARACEDAGTFMMVNWPTTWSAESRMIKTLIDEGAIGRVLEMKCRMGHNGPLGAGNVHKGASESAAPMSGPEKASTWWHQAAMGGGAFLDYCCYGSQLARWLIGDHAVAAMGMKANLNSQWGDADDNGVMIVRFPNAIALLEGTWTTLDQGVPSAPIIYGTDGTLLREMIEGKWRIRLERGHGNTEIYHAEPLPMGRRDIAEEFVYHMHSGEPLHETLQTPFNLETMAILDAGIRSAASGKIEMVNNDSWEIG